MNPQEKGRDFNFVVSSPEVCEHFLQALFCGVDEPLNVEEITFISQNTSMLHLLTWCGVFPSLGQARKNWNKPVEIQDGFSIVTVGKFQTRICTLNATEDLKRQDCEECHP